MFTWKEEYSVNHDIIDQQHKRLFEIGETMEALVKNHSGEDIYDELNAMFSELIDYTIYHFDYEESLMANIDYSDFEQHQIEHRKFVEKLQAVDLKDMEENQSGLAMQLLKTTATWIFKHIIGQDFLYKGQI